MDQRRKQSRTRLLSFWKDLASTNISINFLRLHPGSMFMLMSQISEVNQGRCSRRVGGPRQGEQIALVSSQPEHVLPSSII